MCEKINNLNTPINKRCRSLGLRRSVQNSPYIRTPLSDLKVNRKFSTPEVVSPLTPLCDQNIHELSKSTGCRLTRNYRSYKSTEKCKKKKLEFKEDTTEVCDDNSDCSLPVETSASVETKSYTKEELKSEIELKEVLLKDMINHSDKVQQLKSSIETWKTAFNRALDELSSRNDTPTEKEEILEMLNIPAEVINLVSV